MKQNRCFFHILKKSSYLISFCYGCFFLISLLLCGYQLLFSLWVKHTGTLVETNISLSDFEKIDFVQKENYWITTTPDPRLILQSITDDTPMLVTNLTIKAKFLNQNPGEFCVFYKPKQGMEEFDANYRIWAKEEQEGIFTFDLPQQKIYGLRLDPAIFTNVEMEIDAITLNASRAWWTYFIPTAPWIFAQAVVPLIVASVLRMLVLAMETIHAWYQQKRRA